LLVNPLAEYPRPPFPKQQQPWPELKSRMTPRPDPGEESYKDTGRLAGRTALIAGGGSGMNLASAIARESTDGAINYLPAEGADAREVMQLVRGAGRGRRKLPSPGPLR
jgi:hypothetical protein